ncbi:MAG: YHS domain-containing protein [Planctomycetes bacterium]|nr:YHS domain-containing protein [Planctomycetota bacterium]
MKIFSLALVIITLLACEKAQEKQFSNPTPGKCPVMGGDINPSLTVEYQNKTYAFCCKQCIPKFDENPTKYLNKVSKSEHTDKEHDGHNHD